MNQQGTHPALTMAVAVALAASALSLFFLSTQSDALAKSEPLTVHQTMVNAIDIHRQIQKNKDQWAGLKEEMESRYAMLGAEATALERERAGLAIQVAKLEAKRDASERTVTEAALVREKLQHYLEELNVRLRGRIDRDPPFLQEERARRMKDLEQVLVLPDTGLAEKCRRVMETLKIETEYGRTVEVYQASIRLDEPDDGRLLTVDVLRMGRLALFWRTPDGKRVGHWDLAAVKWAELSGSHRRSINEAMEMAMRRRTVDIVTLPLGRIRVP